MDKSYCDVCKIEIYNNRYSLYYDSNYTDLNYIEWYALCKKCNRKVKKFLEKAEWVKHD